MNKLIVLILSMFTFFGCMSAVSQSDIDELKKEVSQLQLKVTSMESKQAEVYSKYEENLVNADTNAASIQELYKKMSQVSQKVEDIDVILKNQKSDSKVNVKVPSKMYEQAYNDFLLGKYEVAIVGFKSFLKQYGNHDFAPQAQYYIGEAMYSQEKYSDAYEEYNKIEKMYPSSEFVSSARLKMALCLELLNKKDDSIVVLQSILKDYPKSAEAFTAKEKIKIYTNEKSK